MRADLKNLGMIMRLLSRMAPGLDVQAITREILKAPSDLDMELCTSLIRGCFESADYAEGRTAFMQKRKPVFTGR